MSGHVSRRAALVVALLALVVSASGCGVAMHGVSAANRPDVTAAPPAQPVAAKAGHHHKKKKHRPAHHGWYGLVDKPSGLRFSLPQRIEAVDDHDGTLPSRHYFEETADGLAMIVGVVDTGGQQMSMSSAANADVLVGMLAQAGMEHPHIVERRSTNESGRLGFELLIEFTRNGPDHRGYWRLKVFVSKGHLIFVEALTVTPQPRPDAGSRVAALQDRLVRSLQVA